MTDGTPGWFRDPSDPSVARWHDGDKWTEHTLVIADQAPGVEPTPPVIAPPTVVAAEPEFQIPRHGASGGGRFSGLPAWAKIGGPIALVAVIILAFVLTSSGGNNKDDAKTSTNGTEAVSLDSAVSAARKAGLPETITDTEAGALIQRICSAATHASDVDPLGQDLGQLPATSLSDVRTNVSALGVGANTNCASTMSSHPDLVSQLQDQAAIAFSTTTTAVTVAGGTDAGATDAGTSTTVKGGKTATTVKGKTTGTTAKPTTTTTAKPLPQVLPNTGCSTVGASAQNKINHDPLTCQKQCNGSSLRWTTSATCPTLPTVPPGTTPSSTPITTATTAPSGGTDAGTTGGL